MALPRACALLFSAVTMAALAGAVTLALRWPDIDVMAVIITLVLVVPGATVGLVVALRKPVNPVGALICLQAAAFAVIFGWQGAYDDIVGRHPGSLPAVPEIAVFARGSWTMLFLPIGLLMLRFPNGRLLNRHWRPVEAGLVGIAVAFPLIAAVSPRPLPPPYGDLPHPFGTAPLWLQALGWGMLPALLGLLMASAASLAIRYRRTSDPVLRAQIRWLALGAWALPGALLLGWAGLLLFGRPDVAVVGLSLIMVSVPASVAVAMLRHHLYDVDRALSAAATYAILSGIVLGIFTIAQVTLGSVVGRGSAVLAAATTALCMLVMVPAKRRVQRLVDEQVYPRRAALREMLTGLAVGIDQGTAQPEDIESILRRALDAPDLRVGYLLPGQEVARDVRGHPVDGQVPIVLGRTTIGALDAQGASGSIELLREAATASASMVEMARLRLGMAEAMAEVRLSRRRMLSYGYEERHRLERDLHDGAQQRLVALGMSLRMAQKHLGDAGYDVDGVLERSMTQLGTAIEELRTIAAGLRPRSLDAGLDAAVRSLASTVPMPVELEIREVEVSADVATTAYYVVSEGLANAVKHSEAGRLWVRVCAGPDDLIVEVRDDGVGGATPRTGLLGLADRVAAAGGELLVDSAPGAGTRLQAVLPCGS